MKQLNINDLEKISGGIAEGGCVPRIFGFPWRIWF